MFATRGSLLRSKWQVFTVIAPTNATTGMMSTSVELDENFSGYARLSGQTSRSHAHESMQILSNPEEKTLV